MSYDVRKVVSDCILGSGSLSGVSRTYVGLMVAVRVDKMLNRRVRWRVR